MRENTRDWVECYVTEDSDVDPDHLTCSYCGCYVLYDDQPCSALDDGRCRP